MQDTIYWPKIQLAPLKVGATRMKRLAILWFTLLVVSLHGKSPVTKFEEPSSFRYTGMGGAITAVPEGLDILVHNPAGLTQRLFTHRDRFILSFTTQLYFKPQFLFPILQDVSNVDNELGQILLNAKDLITSSGLGATPNLSLGYFGKTWAVGLFATASAFVQGSPFPLGVEGFAMTNLTLPVAYSVRIVEGRRVDISLGGVFHPGIALYKMIDGSDVDAIIADRKDVDDILEGILATPYVSFPVDLGVLMVGHDFLFTGTQFRLGVTLKNMFGDYFVPGQSIEPLPRDLAFNLGVGALFPFSIGKLPIDLVVSAESKAINQLISGSQTFWKSLAFGVELAVADFIRLWGGLSSGYPAVGGKIKLSVFSLGVSWQTMETGPYVGDNPLSIFQVGFSFNF